MPGSVNGVRLTVRAGTALMAAPVAIVAKRPDDAVEVDLCPRLNRLPGYDSRTRGMELAAFLGLGFVGLWLVAGAWRQAAIFAIHRDEIAARLTADSALVAGNATNHALTNLTAIPTTAREHAEPSRSSTRPS